LVANYSPRSIRFSRIALLAPKLSPGPFGLLPRGAAIERTFSPSSVLARFQHCKYPYRRIVREVGAPCVVPPFRLPPFFPTGAVSQVVLRAWATTRASTRPPFRSRAAPSEKSNSASWAKKLPLFAASPYLFSHGSDYAISSSEYRSRGRPPASLTAVPEEPRSSSQRRACSIGPRRRAKRQAGRRPGLNALHEKASTGTACPRPRAPDSAGRSIASGRPGAAAPPDCSKAFRLLLSLFFLRAAYEARQTKKKGHASKCGPRMEKRKILGDAAASARARPRPPRLKVECSFGGGIRGVSSVVPNHDGSLALAPNRFKALMPLYAAAPPFRSSLPELDEPSSRMPPGRRRSTLTIGLLRRESAPEWQFEEAGCPGDPHARRAGGARPVQMAVPSSAPRRNSEQRPSSSTKPVLVHGLEGRFSFQPQGETSNYEPDAKP